jgi:hypothetical protein
MAQLKRVLVFSLFCFALLTSSSANAADIETLQGGEVCGFAALFESCLPNSIHPGSEGYASVATPYIIVALQGTNPLAVSNQCCGFKGQEEI